jgi:hypothetical protein
MSELHAGAAFQEPARTPHSPITNAVELDYPEGLARAESGQPGTCEIDPVQRQKQKEDRPLRRRNGATLEKWEEKRMKNISPIHAQELRNKSYSGGA